MSRPHYTLVTPPESEPVSLEQASDHLRVDSDDDVYYIEGLIAVAREYVDSVTGRVSGVSGWKLIAPTWMSLCGSQVDTFSLFRTPLVSIEAIRYYAPGDGDRTVMSAADYIVVTAAEPGMIKITGDLPAVDDRPDAILIEFTAGYSTPALAPAVLKHAVKSLVAHLYEQRSPVAFASCQNLPFHLETFISNQKVGGHIG